MEVFDDWKSYAHAVIGFIVCFHPMWFILGTLVYVVYEAFTSKRLDEFIGDILEFTFGAYVWFAAYTLWILLVA